MTLSIFKAHQPEAPPSSLRSRSLRRVATVVSLALPVTISSVGEVFAQGAGAGNASVSNGGLGAQLNTMSGEAINAGGTAFGMACYLAAAVCFGLGVWALWQSRQPQNRETGYVGRGIAGLVLCGLFATAGVWIGKAAMTASGGNATINSTPAMVTFGSGNGGAPGG